MISSRRRRFESLTNDHDSQVVWLSPRRMPECAPTRVLRRRGNRLRSNCIFLHGESWVYQCELCYKQDKAFPVPRLELQAAVMASRLKSEIFEKIDLEIDETHFWSDSKIVLYYRRGDSAPTCLTEKPKSFRIRTLRSGITCLAK